MEPLEEGLDRLGICKDALPRLVRYIEEIELFNPSYGLVKVNSRRELVVKHVLDSLTPFPILSSLVPVSAGSPPPAAADAGSGAGFPGIPLSICMPGVHFTLIERMGRRAGFLRDCAAVLGLKNVTVEETEMEKAAPGRFGLIVFRAFRPLEQPVLKGLFRLLAPGGVLAAYKGRRQAVEEEMAAAEKSAPEIAGKWEDFPLEVPFLNEERRLVIIRYGVPVHGIYAAVGEDK
jgi:16S rRNA (guanine527-N7)-methyltransferase